MTPPTRYLWRMLVFLGAVGVVCAVLFEQLLPALATNPVLNALITLVALIGIAWNLRQVLLLRPEVAWLERYRDAAPEASDAVGPRLLGPMASMLQSARGDRLSLSTTAMRTLLDGIGARLDESRELSRYFTGVLIFLGLLGTFWGLLLTIGSVSQVIQSMSLGAGDVGQLFTQLKEGLAKPLTGMGTAFSSSMLGLAGALVLGFLDLTAGQAQSRFYTEVEEWLAGLTRLSSGALGDLPGGEGAVPAYVHALLERTAENLESLQRVVARGEKDRAEATQALIGLTERLGSLADQMKSSQSLMLRLAEQQALLQPSIHALANAVSAPVIDTETRQSLRSVEATLARIAEGIEVGRSEVIDTIRDETKMVARTIAGRIEDPRR